MNFKLKRKDPGKGSGTAKKMKTSAFGGPDGGSDSDSSGDEASFHRAMAEKSKKVAKQLHLKSLAAEEEHYDAVLDNNATAKPKTKSSIVENILAAKEIRNQEHLIAQQKQKDLDLKRYLDSHKDAVVFASEEYKQHQNDMKLVQQKVNQRDEQEEALNANPIAAKSFYSKIIESKLGASPGGDTGPELEVPDSRQLPQLASVAPKRAAKNGDPPKRNRQEIVESTGNSLLSKVMEFIKSTVSDEDIIEAKRKYWDRKHKIK